MSFEIEQDYFSIGERLKKADEYRKFNAPLLSDYYSDRVFQFSPTAIAKSETLVSFEQLAELKDQAEITRMLIRLGGFNFDIKKEEEIQTYWLDLGSQLARADFGDRAKNSKYLRAEHQSKEQNTFIDLNGDNTFS